MSGGFFEAEAKLFCILLTVLIFFFRRRTKQSKKQYFLFSFLLVGLIFSLFGGFFYQTFFYILCALCYAVAFFFWLGIKQPKRNRMFLVFLGALFGVFSFLTAEYSNICAYTIVFGMLYDLISEQSRTIRLDNLTKLYNRYGMDAELKEQFRQYRRENTDSFYLIACDLDNFKHINDTWGHSEGDRALVLVAEALSKVAKRFDANVFRIGGDEFVIITDKSQPGLSENITLAVQAELDELIFRDDFDIRMSIGSALYDGVTSVEELLNNADKKLYETKRIHHQLKREEINL